MSRTLAYAVLVVLCCACTSGERTQEMEVPQEQPVTAVPADSVLHSAVFALPEVQARAAYIDSATHGARKLLVWTSAEPTEEEPYYRIDAGEDNGTALVTHFHFVVTPGTHPLIRVYDAVADTVLTLEQWRVMMQWEKGKE